MNEIKKGQYVDSDTELYIDKNIFNTKKKVENKNNKKSKDINNTNNTISQKKFNTGNTISNITKEQNNTINSKDFSNNENSNEIGLGIFKLNYKEEEQSRKMNFNYPSYPLTKLKSEKINNNLILNIEEPIKKKVLKSQDLNNKDKKINKSSDLLLASEEIGTLSQGYFSSLKNFALNTVKKLKKSNNSENSNKCKHIFKLENGKNDNFNLKNENCTICLGEIEEKFTLICGDFFCRECITQIVRNCLKDITNFDKIKCPICKEAIEENTLKKMLTEEEFNFYQKTTVRIQGIKDKNLIPCPFPDCEGFADKYSNNKNYIYCCQNNHPFCGKCMEVVERKFLKEEKNKHIIQNKNDINIKYLKSNKNIKRCPNCNSWVKKEQKKCNNMTCPNIWCKYEFCWICGDAYDENHYKNPLSMCFGLASADSENDFTKGKGIRFIRCMIIFSILIFIILPIILILLSLFEMIFYIIIFVLDGSALGYIKLKSKFAHRLFYKIAILFYFCISLALVPAGYLSLGVIIVFSPLFCLIKKARKDDDFD